MRRQGEAERVGLEPSGDAAVQFCVGSVHLIRGLAVWGGGLGVVIKSLDSQRVSRVPSRAARWIECHALLMRER